MKRLRAVFAGTGTFAIPILQALQAIADIELVITQAEKKTAPASTSLSPIQQFCAEHELPIIAPQSIKECVSQLAALHLDVLVVADYGQIIPSVILELPRFGAINVHPSLLPRHRGATPISAAILAGDDVTGVTLIRMDAKMDHGPILAQESRPLTGKESAVTLRTELGVEGARLLRRALPLYVGGKLKPQAQEHKKATYTKLLIRDDGRLHPDETSATFAYRKFRAMQPWPGLWLPLLLRGRSQRVKLLDVSPSSIRPGTIASGQLFRYDSQLFLACEEGSLAISLLQVSGAKVQDATSFCNGYRDDISNFRSERE